MRRITIALMIATALLLCAALAPGRGSDFEVEKRHVKSLELRNVSARNGKNVALDIVVAPPAGVKLSRGITALVNSHQVRFYDDGRWPNDRADSMRWKV